MGYHIFHEEFLVHLLINTSFINALSPYGRDTPFTGMFRVLWNGKGPSEGGG
jgi:hypothetical protein